MKYAFIEDNQQIFSIIRMCRVLSHQAITIGWVVISTISRYTVITVSYWLKPCTVKQRSAMDMSVYMPS